ncbi:MAG: DNA-directed DNA polymerase II small subunit [Promethearchaeia archaeon]
MQSSNIQKKVIHKFLQSGINVTPKTLDVILNLENPLEKLSAIIKDVSFLPNFESLLTPQILEKLQDKEIQSILRRKTIQDTPPDNQISKEKIQKESSELSMEPPEPPDTEADIEQQDFHIDDLDVSDGESFSESFGSMESTETSSVADQINSVVQDPVGTRNEEQSVTASTIQTLERPQRENKSTERSDKEQSVQKPVRENGSTGGGFNPLAKEYDSQLEILKDPTGQLYTSGEYQDFYDLYTDKFERLEKLIRKRPDVISANKIKNIYRLSGSVEVSVYGLIQSHRRTKNGHYFLTIEDKTGSMNVLIRNDSENELLIDKANKLLNDQMIYVKGTYKPGDKRKGIIFAEELTAIEIPTDYQPNLAPEPLSIAYVSDLHIGSYEFEEKIWNRFIDFLNGRVGNQNMRKIAGRIKYLVINGDLVDGIGVYPNQKEDLVISDIYAQYEKATELLSDVPDYIKIIYSSGNHAPVRNAIPRAAVPEKYAESLLDLNINLVGNPALVKTHGVKTLVYHGDSMIDINQMISGLKNKTPVKTMVELLKSRHLAPIYGFKTQIAPIERDWLVIEEIPDVFTTGHIHIYGRGSYRNVQLVNSGCFQAQTDFMKSFGIEPTPGIVPVFDLDSLKGYELDFKKHI